MYDDSTISISQNHTWTLDSGKFIFMATSSLMKMSGYRVLLKSSSKISSWALVNVVRSLRCFRGCPVRNTSPVKVESSEQVFHRSHRREWTTKSKPWTCKSWDRHADNIRWLLNAVYGSHDDLRCNCITTPVMLIAHHYGARNHALVVHDTGCV